MKRYAMMFHAEIHAESQQSALEIADKIENAIPCDLDLIRLGGYLESFGLDDYELLDEELK